MFLNTCRASGDKMKNFWAVTAVVLSFPLPAVANAALGSVTLPALGECTSHRDTAQRLKVVGHLAKGQYLYVTWGEIEDGIIRNYGENQLFTMKGGKPQSLVKPAQGYLIDGDKYSDGWYAYQLPMKDALALQYYNRGYTPTEFQVTLCVTDRLTNPPVAPPLVP